MKTTYLLANKYKRLGWVLLCLGLIGGIYMYVTDFDSMETFKIKVFTIYNEPFLGKSGFFKIIENGVFDEICAILIIIGGLLVGFSKEKQEDEYIYKLRKDSLVWALILHYIILLIAIILVYDMSFFHVLIFNMFTPLLFFVIRFNFLKYKQMAYEE